MGRTLRTVTAFPITTRVLEVLRVQDVAEVRQTFAWARSEWGMNTPPHIAWLKEDGYEPPRID